MNEPTIADSGPWSLGTLIAMPVGLALAIAFAIGGVWLIRSDRNLHPSSADKGLVKWLGIGSLGAAFISLGATAWGMYPYSAEYHQWRDVSGTVAKIDDRLIGTGDGMETKFVVRFEGSGMQFACDDTRCAQVEPGDALTLSCKRAWQYTGTDGYDCRFVATEAAR